MAGARAVGGSRREPSVLGVKAPLRAPGEVFLPRVSGLLRARPLTAAPSVRNAHRERILLPLHVSQLPPRPDSAGVHSNGIHCCYAERTYPRRTHPSPSILSLTSPCSQALRPALRRPASRASLRECGAVVDDVTALEANPRAARGTRPLRASAGQEEGACVAPAQWLWPPARRAWRLHTARSARLRVQAVRRHVALAGHVVALRHQRLQR